MTRRDGPGRPPHPDVLTPGEWRVAEAVRHGLANKDIAARQGVSVDAVKFHIANILAKLGMTTRAELRRWSGVRVDSQLHAARELSQEDAPFGTIGQISRTVADIDAARTWYGDILGLRHLYTYGTLAFFDCGGARLFLSQGAVTPESILYFKVQDIHATKARLETRGVEFTHAPHIIHRHPDGTEEWMAFFKDNEGRMLALMSQVGPAET